MSSKATNRKAVWGSDLGGFVVNTDEQKIEDELEDLVAKVKKQQEQLKQEVRAQQGSEAKVDDFDDLDDELKMPKVERIQEDLPVVKNRGQMIVDTIFGEKITDKARVAIAFSLGLTCFYFYTIFMPLVTAGIAGYGAYRFFQWKKNRKPETPDGEEIIDVEA